MKKPASLALITLLMCISLGSVCLGADPASPALENKESAGAKPGGQQGEARPDDSFERMAQATVQELKANALFEGMDFEIFVARPFVILMNHDPDADQKALEERKGRLGKLAQGIWRNWLKVRSDWELQSTRNDTLEQPEPFVWISFQNEAAYDRFMKKFRPKGTAGSRAYYSTENHFVFTHEDPHRDPATILIHETFHQLMDRFSKVSSTGYQSYCFTEGLAEYFAGYRGEGESLQLGQLNRPRRADEIRRLHTYFDDKQNVCYPWHERRLQITPDDWIFFDVPMLLTFRDKMWTEAISNALIKHFERSDYVTRQEGKDLVKDGAIKFHSAFYAFSWAFTYWLRENHPKEYDRYARTVLNTDRGGDAEVFLESFGIEPVRPLPDIQSLVGPKNRDVQKNMQKAVQCLDQRIAILRQTPAIQEMHRQWADWMRTTFPKLPNAPTKHPLTELSDDKNAAIDRVIVKGDKPKMIYVPIIHDDQFSRISSTDQTPVRDIMSRCEEIADHLYQRYGVRDILLEGLSKEFVERYNRVPLDRRQPSKDDNSGMLVHRTWTRLLAGKAWKLLPASDRPLVGPLTALGRDYDTRIVAVLDEAKKNGWFRNRGVFEENQAALQNRLEVLAAEYNAKHRAILAEDPDLKREYGVTVTKRNKEFLDHILAPDEPGVVFFGAGHWQDIEEQLTARGTSYAVVVPKGVTWPPGHKDAATIKADMLKLGAKLRETSLTLGDGTRAAIKIPIE